MKKFILHWGKILLLLLMVGILSTVHLYDLPIIKYLDYLFYFVVGIALLITGWKWHKIKSVILLGVVLNLTFPVLSASLSDPNLDICTYQKLYKAQIDVARDHDWVGDIPCDDDQWDKARSITADSKVKESYMLGVPGSSFTSEEVCARTLMTLCSDYVKRHPELETKTVPVILNEDNSNVFNKTSSTKLASSCWPCDMAYVIFMSIQSLASSLSTKMANFALSILEIFFLVWIIFKAITMIAFPQGITFFGQVLTKLLGCVVAAIILYHPAGMQTLYTDVLTPVMQLGVGFGDEITNAVGLDSKAFQDATKRNKSFYDQLQSEITKKSVSLKITPKKFMDYCSNTYTAVGPLATSTSTKLMDDALGSQFRTDFPQIAGAEDNTLLTHELRVSLLCITQRYYHQFQPFVAIGQSLISFSIHAGNSSIGVFNFFKNFKMWWIGVVLVCIFTFFGYLVAFKLIDIFLRLAFLLILFPMFVATAVFPMTRGFTKKGWEFILQTMVDFIGLALAISVIMILFEVGISPDADEIINTAVLPYSDDYGKNLLDVMTTKGAGRLTWMLCGIAFLGWSLFKSMSSIVNQLFGLGGLPDNMMGTVVVGAVQNVQSNVLGPVGSLARTVGDKTGDGFNKGSKMAAKGIDKAGSAAAKGIDALGMGAGKALSATGIGAVVGMPLMAATKLTSTSVRAGAKAASFTVRAAGKTAELGIKAGSRILTPGSMFEPSRFAQKDAGKGTKSDSLAPPKNTIKPPKTSLKPTSKNTGAKK